MLKPILLAIILTGCFAPSELSEPEQTQDPPIDPPETQKPIQNVTEETITGIPRITWFDNPYGNAPEEIRVTGHDGIWGIPQEDFLFNWTLVDENGDLLYYDEGTYQTIILPEIGIYFLRLSTYLDGNLVGQTGVRLGTGEFYEDPIQCSGSYETRECPPYQYYIPEGMQRMDLYVSMGAGDVDRLVMNRGNPELQGEVTVIDPNGEIYATTRFMEPNHYFDAGVYRINMHDDKGFTPGNWSIKWTPDHFGPDVVWAIIGGIEDVPHVVDWPVFFDGWMNPEATPRNQRPESPDFQRWPSIVNQFYDIGCHGLRIRMLHPEDPVIPPANYSMHWIAYNENGTEAAKGEGWDTCWQRPPLGRYQFTGTIMDGEQEIEQFNRWARAHPYGWGYDTFRVSQEWITELQCDPVVFQVTEATGCEPIRLWAPANVTFIKVDMWPENILDPHTRDDGTTGNVTITSPSGKLIASQGASSKSLQGSDWENYIRIYEPTQEGYWTFEWEADQAIAKEGIVRIVIQPDIPDDPGAAL